jgi:Tol biopolymer transport system component
LQRRIWRTDRDGSDPRRVTNSPDDELLGDVSPDGKQVIYARVSEPRLLELVSQDGAAPKSIANLLMGDAQFSPDGKRVFYSSLHTLEGRVEFSTRVVNTDGTGEDSLAHMPSRAARIQWLADGSGLTYDDPADSSGNVFRVGLDGSGPTQVTHVTDGRVEAHGWSPDGRLLLLGIRKGRTVNLWLTDANGGNLRPLTRFDTGTVFDAHWNADSQSVVFLYGINSSDAVLIRAAK